MKATCSPRSLSVGMAMFATVAMAAVDGVMAAESNQKIAFESYRLKNGLNVILHEDHRLPLVTVNIWYYVGSKDEAKGRSGFAHLFEHLMFMGTEEVPRGRFDTTIESLGGSNNATTSQDRTNYFDWGPANMLETLLYLEADRMKAFGRGITQAKLDTQREVVRNERRQRYENRPYGQAFLEIFPHIYPPGHPYHQPVIGSHEDLENATVQDVTDFFARFYVPNNASLVVAGDFDPTRAREWIEKYFGVIERSENPRHASASAVSLDRQISIELSDHVPTPRTQFIYTSPAFYKDGDADLDVASYILGDGKSSRLYKRLVFDKELAQSVSASQWSSLLGSVYIVEATARPGVELADLEKEIDAIIAEFLAAPPTKREVQRARNQVEMSFWHEVETLRGRADLLNRYQFYYHDPGAIEKDTARYAGVTQESVHGWAKKVFGAKGRLIIRVHPKLPAPPPG